MNKPSFFFLRVVFLSLLSLPSAFTQTEKHHDADRIETIDPFLDIDRVRVILRTHLSKPGYDEQQLLDEYDRVLGRANNDDTKDIVSLTLLKKAEIFFHTAIYGEALKIYYEALDQFTARGDSINAAITKLKIRQVFFFADLGLPADLAAEAYRVLISSSNDEHKAIAYYTKWQIEADTPDRQVYLKKAVELQRKVVNVRPSVFSLDYYARFLNASNDYVNAIEAAETAGNNWLLVLILNNYGYEVADKGEYQNALNIFMRSFEICKTHHYRTLLRNTAENIARVYRLMGNYKLSSHYQQLMFVITETLYSDRFSDQISAQKVKYEVEKKELENKFLRNEKTYLEKVSDARENLIYLLILSIGAVSFVLYLVYKSRRKLKAANNLLDEQNSEIMRRKQELESLNSELTDSERKLKDAQLTAHLCNWDLDLKKNEIYLSDLFYEIFPYDIKESTLETTAFISRFVSAGFREAVTEFFNNSENSLTETEFNYQHEGIVRWIRAKKMQNGKTAESRDHVSGTFQDITIDKEEELIKIRIAEQQSFTRKLIQSQEEERKRIAGELHDGLGQELLLIKNRAIFGLQNQKKDEFSAKQFNEIDKSVSAILKSVREISLDLTPAHLGRLGLRATVNSMIEKAAASGGIETEAEIDDIDTLFADEDKIHLFRIVQESINNILKHSEADRAYIGIKLENNEVKIIIRDNGKGFRIEEVRERTGGFGLKNLMNRIELLNGTIEVSSGEIKGTTLLISIPVKTNGH